MSIARYLAIAVAALLAGMPARAANFSFTGSFAHDTDLQVFTFTLAADTPGVALRTWSYAGGTNAAGQVIPLGGFEPILNLYLADGTQMNPGVSGPCTAPPTGNPLADLLPDPATGACGDVYYPTELSFPGGVWAAGTYTLVLSVVGNPGLGDLPVGFFIPDNLGLPVPSNYTCQEGPIGFQGSPPTVPTDQPFCDRWASGVQRTGFWALDILNVDSATGPAVTAVPEPGTLALSLAGALFLAGYGMRRRA